MIKGFGGFIACYYKELVDIRALGYLNHDCYKLPAISLKQANPASTLSIISAAKIIRFRQFIQVSKRLIFQPKNIQADFISGNDLIITKLTPAAFWVALFIPCFCTLMTVFRVKTSNEIL